MGKTVDVNDIKKQIIIRDDQDRSRGFGALKQADDAVYVDTSFLTKDEVLEKIVQIIKDNAKGI
jgi:cytidylate kinase